MFNGDRSSVLLVALVAIGGVGVAYAQIVAEPYPGITSQWWMGNADFWSRLSNTGFEGAGTLAALFAQMLKALGSVVPYFSRPWGAWMDVISNRTTDMGQQSADAASNVMHWMDSLWRNAI